VVTAPGLDGELPAATVLSRLDQLDALELPSIDSQDLADARKAFTWHPSESSGLLAAAAAGRRGRVEVRDAGDQVELTDLTATLFSVDVTAATEVTPARWLVETRSLDEADRILREKVGISELVYETEKAHRLSSQDARTPTQSDLLPIDELARQARDRGAGYVSMRRLAELLGARTLDTFAALSALLADERPNHYEPSLYRV